MNRLQGGIEHLRDHPTPHSAEVMDLLAWPKSAGQIDAHAVLAVKAEGARSIDDVHRFADGLPLAPCGDWIEGIQVNNCQQAVVLDVFARYSLDVLQELFGAAGDRLFWQFWLVYARWLNNVGEPVSVRELEDRARTRGLALDRRDLLLLEAVGLIRDVPDSEMPNGKGGFMPLLNCIPCASKRFAVAREVLAHG